MGQSTKDFDASGIKVTKGDSIHYYQHDVLGMNNISVMRANLKVYPNPSTGKFAVQWNEITGNSVLKIYNVLGEEVKSMELTGNANEVDLSSSPNGVYFYKVLSSNSELIGRGKIVIQK